jgi:hypothetical protein
MKKSWITLLLLMTLVLSGCSHWSTKEKILFVGAASANAADYYTTTRYLDIGGTEANPLLGKRPNHGEVLTFKAISLGVCFLAGELFPEDRENIFFWNMLLSGGAAGWNHHQYEKHK